MKEPQRISSRNNPVLANLRKLVRDNAAYRVAGEVWLEGEHLCQAAAQRGQRVAQAVLTEAAWQDPALRALADSAAQVFVVPEGLFKTLSTLESPAPIGFVLKLDATTALQAGAMTLVLDRLQDPGNVGSMLRTAAAFGVTQVLALDGTAALWSPKVLRAGMGAHFALNLVESLQIDDLAALDVPLLATSSRDGVALHEAVLPFSCAWVFGQEGQGVSSALAQRCEFALRIPQPGGEDSLNVVAAAAICLYESQRQRDKRCEHIRHTGVSSPG
ncbi:MAG: RNA methyltransferase [Burkholderiaceae bacterium]|nr:RNA methyltransferase [Burkholderiaceae bacterium]